MARIRTIKPDFFRSGSLARCSRDARMTFAGLWTEADDLGRGEADPRLLKGALWALDDDISAADVRDHLDQLARSGHIRLYAVDGDAYYEVAKWEKHQAAAYRRGEAKHPAPPEVPEPPSPNGLHDEACKKVQDASSWVGSGVHYMEGKGRETTTTSEVTQTELSTDEQSSSSSELTRTEWRLTLSRLLAERSRTRTGAIGPYAAKTLNNLLHERPHDLDAWHTEGLTPLEAADQIDPPFAAPPPRPQPDPNCHLCDGDGWAHTNPDDLDSPLVDCECLHTEPALATVHQLRGASA